MAALPPTPPDSWISDLIKIGIPSLVALASGLYSYLLGRAGHKKDILIEKLRSDSDQWKIQSEKKSALVMDIVAKISAVENAMARHSGIFRTEKIHDESNVPLDVMSKLRAAYDDVGVAIDACIGARAQVELLGDPELSPQFAVFLESLFTFQTKARPDNFDPFELTEWFNRISPRKEAVLKKLSAIHLAKQA